MNAVLSLPKPRSNFAANLGDEAISLSVGALFTLGLFVSMAYFEHTEKKTEPEPMEDLRVVSMPLDIPPPPPLVQTEPQPDSTTVTGIDVAASESPVRITAALPVPESLSVPLAPPANIRISSVLTDFKPQMDLTNEVKHVYQQTEVDRKPFVVVNTKPYIPSIVRNNADNLRVVLLMIIDTNGTANDIRVLKSSGNSIFDDIIIRCVREEWVFSPAVKKGKNVRCLVQRTISVTWSSSHFET